LQAEVQVGGAIPEKRVHPRRALRARVVFEDEYGDGIFYSYSEDVSMGGLFLASAIPVRIGTLLFLSFAIPPHRRPVRVTGEVVRLGGGGGMGIRFAGIGGHARERLERFLARPEASPRTRRRAPRSRGSGRP
jgi:Tfp pilus assembly protein PilZ